MTLDPQITARISPSLSAFLEHAGLSRQPSRASLYHYCSADGLRGMLTNGDVFATDARFFNDTSEFEYGLSLLEQPLDRFKSAGLAEVGLQGMYDHLERRLKNRGGYDVFISCYCEIDDLVSQWRGYGAGGAGYSIGFPWQALSRNGAALLIGVVYGDEAITAAANKTVDIALVRLAEAMSRDDALSMIADILTCITVTLLILAICAKKTVFAFEQEFRLIHLMDNESSAINEAIEFRAAGGMLVPYVRLPLPRDEGGRIAVSSVRCGPSFRDAATELGVKALLRRRDLFHVPVLVSDAPLRST